MDSERIEEYLEAIYKRQRTETPVSTSALAGDLGVSLPAVTDMLRRLANEGFIEYTANKGAILTNRGNKKALSVIRRHRLWERFLSDILGMKWDKVHNEACRLEHATSPETENKLASLLGNVDTCPHGHPIPDKDGNIREQHVIPILDFEPGQSVCIETVIERKPDLLGDIDKLGLKPKTIVDIEKKNSDGSVELKVEGQHQRLGKEIAELLLAHLVPKKGKTATVEEIALSRLSSGESGIIKSYASGRSMLGRCLSLGFTPGSLVKMLRNSSGGPVLVKIHDTEVALGRGVAEKIVVARNK
ncbi:MAG: FeoA domain-containing protein [Dehalococcoidales bacterium]|nr:FeoA domain-containing protein [Dehalococcoidales bacterium]